MDHPILLCFRCKDRRADAGERWKWRWSGFSRGPCADCGHRYAEQWDPCRLLVVEFDKDLHPLRATVETIREHGPHEEEFDCAWSRADQRMYYHGVGGGPAHFGRGKTPYIVAQLLCGPGSVESTPDTPAGMGFAPHFVWATPDVRLDIQSRTCTRLPTLPAGYAEMELIEAFELDTRTVYCQMCQDEYADEIGRTCDHLIWCDQCSAWSGTGMVREDSGCEHYPEAVES